LTPILPARAYQRATRDMFLVDAVVHAFNWTQDNFAIPEARGIAETSVDYHRMLTRDDASRLTRDEFLRNWQAEQVEAALFVESRLDLIAYHGTPIFDFWKDGHSATSKGLELRERNPGRVLVYGACNPFDGEAAIRRLESLVERDRVDGIKMYAARYADGKTYAQPLDDPEYGYPFIERAGELGVRVIAVHKALPFGPVRSEPFGVTDISEPCASFPDMNFEVVHAGYAFLEQTAFLAGMPNVWFNLENTAALLMCAPRRFAEVIGTLLASGAGDRIMFASGCALVHPAPLIKAFLEFEMPPDLVQGYGFPELTDDIKAGILGENFLRLHDLTVDTVREKVKGDRWERLRVDAGCPEPWSDLRRMDQGDWSRARDE
jgi:predicted TIM-barrel fold metal-dependent hydrolase